MINTDIQWCDSTVNPSENCDGCELWNTKADVRRCYAGKMTERWKGTGAFDLPIVLKPGRMAKTLKWPDLSLGDKRPDKPWLYGLPRIIFVGDMADLFSKGVPFDYIEKEVVDTASISGHIYLLLTKQANRMEDFVEWYTGNPAHLWPSNLWLGVSVTSMNTRIRIRALRNARNAIERRTGAHPKFFVSYGPVLEAVDFSGYSGAFDWMVIEGESGPGGTKLEVSTVRSALSWCRDHQVAPFVKQMGSAWAKAERAIHPKGGDMSEWPEDIRVREMPIPIKL